MIPKTHRRVVLARRPPAEPAESDFRVEEVPVPEPGPRQLLVRVVYLSLDPYMRGRMRDAASYAAPVGIGEVMTGGTVGEVVQVQPPRLQGRRHRRGPAGLAGVRASRPARRCARSMPRSRRSPPPTVCSACPA